MLLKKLVIAEDEEAIAHLVSAGLGDAGFLCLRARDGETALNLVRTELPDLLILDVMMPKMDGIDVCKRIKGDVVLSRVPILMLTSLSGVESRVEGLEAGADDYLSKPFDLRELAARVKALIRQSRRERDRNPTTNLPGREAVEDQLTELMRRNESFALLYIDIDHFRAFTDVYGYVKAGEVVAHMGQLVLQECRLLEPEPPFLAHLGGDDFIVVCSSAAVGSCLAESIRESFTDSLAMLYPPEDLERGYTLFEEPTGEERHDPLMSASVAIIAGAPGQFVSLEQLAVEITHVKAEGRRRHDPRRTSGPMDRPTKS